MVDEIILIRLFALTSAAVVISFSVFSFGGKIFLFHLAKQHNVCVHICNCRVFLHALYMYF